MALIKSQNNRDSSQRTITKHVGSNMSMDNWADVSLHIILLKSSMAQNQRMANKADHRVV